MCVSVLVFVCVCALVCVLVCGLVYLGAREWMRVSACTRVYLGLCRHS